MVRDAHKPAKQFRRDRPGVSAVQYALMASIPLFAFAVGIVPEGNKVAQAPSGISSVPASSTSSGEKSDGTGEHNCNGDHQS